MHAYLATLNRENASEAHTWAPLSEASGRAAIATKGAVHIMRAASRNMVRFFAVRSTSKTKENESRAFFVLFSVDERVLCGTSFFGTTGERGLWIHLSKNGLAR